jgi:hypothetical protein
MKRPRRYHRGRTHVLRRTTNPRESVFLQKRHEQPKGRSDTTPSDWVLRRTFSGEQTGFWMSVT